MPPFHAETIGSEILSGGLLDAQLYVAGEDLNANDFLYRRIPDEQRPLVTAEFKPAISDGAEFSARWDIVIGTA